MVGRERERESEAPHDIILPHSLSLSLSHTPTLHRSNSLFPPMSLLNPLSLPEFVTEGVYGQTARHDFSRGLNLAQCTCVFACVKFNALIRMVLRGGLATYRHNKGMKECGGGRSGTIEREFRESR